MKIEKKYYCIFLLVIVLVSVFVCSSCFGKKSEGTNTASGTNTSGSNSSKNDLTPASLEKNITCSGAITKEGNLIAFIMNSNNVAVEVEVEVEFYDTNGALVGSDKESLNSLASNNEAVVEFWDTPNNFDNYKIYVDAVVSSAISYSDKVTLSHNNTGREVLVQVTNNSEEEIERVEVAIVYYLNNEVVGYDDDTEYDVKIGRSGNFTFDYPTDKRYNNVSFDSYKVFVNQVYSYNWSSIFIK